MQISRQANVPVKNITINSVHLQREVLIDLYLPPYDQDINSTAFLLINDGQDLPKFHFDIMLAELYANKEISPILCAGIHCGPERRMEYGTVSILDYKGRGAKAKAHQDFVFNELMPVINSIWKNGFKEKAYAGFSLGGLSAIDTVWHYPNVFKKRECFLVLYGGG